MFTFYYRLSQLNTLYLLCSYLLWTETNPIGTGIYGYRTLALKAIKPGIAAAEVSGMIWAEMNLCAHTHGKIEKSYHPEWESNPRPSYLYSYALPTELSGRLDDTICPDCYQLSHFTSSLIGRPLSEAYILANQ